MILSCNQNNAQLEKEYIKNLEEKNRLLEEELEDAKRDHKETAQGTRQKYSRSIKKNTENKKVQEPKKNPSVSTGYFTIGSTEAEVIALMGDPSSYHNYGWSKTFYYGSSSIEFEYGIVKGYNNSDKNLKVKVK